MVNVAAVSVAAAFESYYRAAMNSLMNASLSGVRPPTLFPNMHVQIPTRVAYINGFKATRQVFIFIFPQLLGVEGLLYSCVIVIRVFYFLFLSLLKWLSNEAKERMNPTLSAQDRALLLLAPALLPGIIMTPISGLLEACNAGHR